MIMSEREPEGFKVVDKRHSARQDDSGEAAVNREASEEGASARGEGESKEQPKGSEERRPPLPEVTFATFVLSLNTSALFHLGEIQDPESGQKRQDLYLAQHAIDTLAMLKDKTAGNLTADENALLEHILFDLRMRFVRARS